MSLLPFLLFALVLLSSISEAQVPRIEAVSFPTNVVASTTTLKPVTLTAQLHLPAGPGPYSVVVITPSSGGEKADRETYYAQELAKSGIAALSVESFRSRGLKSSVHDQSVLLGWVTENDAVAALRWLSSDPRFRKDRIGITGVSKGGQAALNTAYTVRRRWTEVGPAMFAAHAPIAPPCTITMQTLVTTGKPILFMLAERDDQTPAVPCVNLADDMRRAGNPNISVKIYENAHHAWETLGSRPYYDAKAENYAACRNKVSDTGLIVLVDGGSVPRGKEREHYVTTCMKLGTHCCGGSPALKAEATRDLIAFFRRSGF